MDYIMNASRFTKILGLTLFSAFVSINALAQSEEHSLEWDYEWAIYGWLKGLEGTTGNTEIDLDFWDDIIDRLEGVLMTSFEASNGLVSVFGHYEYADIGDDARISRDFDYTIPPAGPTVPISAGTKVKLNVRQQAVQLGAGYSIGGDDRTDWRILGGLKWWEDKTSIRFGDIKLTGPGGIELPSLKGRRITEKDDWWHPFLGLGVSHQLNDSWRLRGRGDYGYRDSDNTSWMLEFIADWRFNDWGALEFGYRHLDIDYDNDSSSHPFSYDVEESGPRVGLIVRF